MRRRSVTSRFEVEEQAQLREAFVSALEHLRDPAFTPPHVDPKRLDHEISRRMACIATNQAIPPKDDGPLRGFVSRAGIRKTQAAWLPYRDTFVALIQKQRPNTDVSPWRAWLNQARIEQLREFSDGC